MEVSAIKLPHLKAGFDLLSVLDAHITHIAEGTVIAIASKIISISESRIVSRKKTSKIDLIKQEAESVLTEPQNSLFPETMLTIKHGLVVPCAGIDESNCADDSYVLYPVDPMGSAETIWRHLRQQHKVKACGVLITDSTVVPLRRGVIGVGLAWCGFAAIHDYRGQQDCFGRELRMTAINNVDALATAATLVMGEGAESTPVAILQDILRLEFRSTPPTFEELELFKIPTGEDLYGPLLVEHNK
ncbi:MAG: coenzyme F420-0:L-glutamate ligase [Proteobacteria bacterium]|nr:coenzyme F420-0:L-glutamate ligase [Pseudomonadota bacterium]